MLGIALVLLGTMFTSTGLIFVKYSMSFGGTLIGATLVSMGTALIAHGAYL